MSPPQSGEVGLRLLLPFPDHVLAKRLGELVLDHVLPGSAGRKSGSNRHRLGARRNLDGLSGSLCHGRSLATVNSGGGTSAIALEDRREQRAVGRDASGGINASEHVVVNIAVLCARVLPVLLVIVLNGAFAESVIVRDGVVAVVGSSRQECVGKVAGLSEAAARRIALRSDHEN